MKFLHLYATYLNGQEDRLRQAYIDFKKLYKFDIRRKNSQKSSHMIDIAVQCEDNNHIYLCTPWYKDIDCREKIDELRKYIPILLRRIKEAPDGIVLRTFTGDEWDIVEEKE